ncbi:MAG: metallophosphoesterase [bacterium]
MPRIIHLSDIHLTKTHLDNFRVGTFSALLEDLKEYHKNLAINLIVISGDMVDRGGASFNNNLTDALKTFEHEFISKLAAGLNIERDRFLFVPGNHDLDRSADSQIVESGLKAKLISKQSVTDYLHVATPPGGNPEGIKRIIPYNTFFKSYYSGFKGKCHLGGLHSSFKFSDGQVSIGVSCINSAWRTYDSSADRGHLLIGESELLANLTLIRECDVKIAVFHHPIELLSDIEKRDIQALVSKEYDMLLCGHCHSPGNQVVFTPDNCLFTSMAPCNWSENYSDGVRHLNGYSVLDFDRTTNKITVNSRCYSPDRKKYVPNEHLGDNGISEFPISRSGGDLAATCLLHINQRHIPELDEHLLSHGTDTKSPKRIEEIFVLPRLVYDVKYKEEKKEEKEYSLDDLCGLSYDLVLFGIKESGKTLLLDRICVELAKRYNEFREIPILIRFSELRNENYETLVSRFLNVPITSTEDFLANHKVVLLIDDLSFDEINSEKLKKLAGFKRKYSSTVRLLATSVVEGEGTYPVNFLGNEYIPAKPASIRTFKTKQIKDLIAKWFSGNHSQNNKQNLERLLEVLKGLNLPGTPLSLSMFLWIIEQHGGYRPINQAAMLENFIEKILEKHSGKEIYSEQFDYKNKERLLADIAHKMNELDNPGYKIPYPDLLAHVSAYLNARKFSFDGEVLVNELIGSGILIKEAEGSRSLIKFRFTCFFEYFVMKRIEFDEDFRCKSFASLGDFA